MITILFSGNTLYETKTFAIPKGEAELDMIVVSGRNLDNDIVIMNMRGTIKAATK